MDVLFSIFGLFDFRFLIFCLFGVLIFWVLDFFYVVILGFRVCRFCFFFLFGPNTLSLSDPISDALSDPIYDPISWQSGTRKWVRRHPWGVPGGGLGLSGGLFGAPLARFGLQMTVQGRPVKTAVLTGRTFGMIF